MPLDPLVRICCLETVQQMHLHDPKWVAFEKTNGKPCPSTWCCLGMFASVCISSGSFCARGSESMLLVFRALSRTGHLLATFCHLMHLGVSSRDGSTVGRCRESWLNWRQGEAGSCADSRWVGRHDPCFSLLLHDTPWQLRAAGGQVDTILRLKFAELEPKKQQKLHHNNNSLQHLSKARGTSRGAHSSAEKISSTGKTVLLHLQILYMKMCTNQEATRRVAEQHKNVENVHKWNHDSLRPHVCIAS